LAAPLHGCRAVPAVLVLDARRGGEAGGGAAATDLAPTPREG